ncbi:MAG: HipA N-terminal domain-containing protein [Oligoflexus sp.]|nr:HipA N-terminal domain-containing protein [Oligoflexus sp.]
MDSLEFYPKALSVFWENDLVGRIFQTEAGRLSFQYAESWLNGRRTAISFSLPLQKEAFGEVAHSYFGNLLPEGDFRRKIEKLFQVSLENDFSLLKHIGGDCAGALSIGSTGGESGYYQTLPNDDVRKIIYTEGVSGIVQGAQHNRLSLAGAQGKLPLRFRQDRFELPCDGAASTHIIKLNRQANSYPKLVENEYFMTNVALYLRLFYRQKSNSF